MRFPLQVVAKSRTPEEHIKYYRWVHFINGVETAYVDWDSENDEPITRPTWRVLFGYRTRWFLTAMDLVPKVIWRRLPVRWQTAHLFGDLE